MKRLLCAAVLTCLGLSGCLHLGQIDKEKAAEIAKEKDLDIRTVGEVTEIANVGQWQVSGVGLVTGLAGTGDAPKGVFRTELEQQLGKQSVNNVKAVLNDPNNALVLVTGFIPPGASKGDPLDIEITLPEGSKCSSLAGGYLHETVLWNHADTRRLSPDSGGSRVLKGHVLARAKGKLLVGLGNPGEPTEERRGRVWEGGVSMIERPFYFALKQDDKSARAAADVATRINLMFREDAKKRDAVMRNRHLLLLENVTHNLNRSAETLGREDMAKAVSPAMIHARLPYVYRLNPERFLRVVRLMPLREDPGLAGPYRRRLTKMLMDPADTVRATMRLEALGADVIPVLKEGLTSPHPLVRFSCAESLIYLNNLAGVEELTKLAAEVPLFRMNCLLALAASDESLCKQKLALLMSNPDTELRCGAFWAMRLNRDLKEEDPAHRTPHLRTEPIGRVFWLHRPAPESTPLVQVTVQGRSEVALFGQGIAVQAPARVMAGPEFIITLEKGDRLCMVSRFLPGMAPRRQQCGLLLQDVMGAMIEMGAGYPEIVDLIRNLDSAAALPCPVAINILPQVVDLERLITEGRTLGMEPAAAASGLARETPRDASTLVRE